MFTVNTSKGKYKIGFSHNNEKGSIYRYTIATLYDENDAILERQDANCHPEDNFNKSQGRKISLSRLIKRFNRGDRTIIWEEYFKLHKKE